MVSCVHYRLFHFPGVGNADTEENPQLSKVFSLKKPIVGQNIALHAQPSAKNSFYFMQLVFGSLNFIFSKPSMSKQMNNELLCVLALYGESTLPLK